MYRFFQLLAQFQKGSGSIGPLSHEPTSNQERVLKALLIDRAHQVQEQNQVSHVKQVNRVSTYFYKRFSCQLFIYFLLAIKNITSAKNLFYIEMFYFVFPNANIYALVFVQ